MKNLISILFFVCTQTFFAQTKSKYPQLIIVNSDTLICFSKNQARQLSVWNENRKECIETQKQDKETIDELEKIRKYNLTLISNLESEVNLHKKNIEDKNKLLSISEDEKNSLKKEIKKQRRNKNIAIIGGAGVFILTCLVSLL